MKDSVGIVNCAIGGVIDEVVVKALDSGKFYLLDYVFGEPKPK
jgi:lactate dehydrogenase-like 2-hydroxyacid dehydrogenase